MSHYLRTALVIGVGTFFLSSCSILDDLIPSPAQDEPVTASEPAPTDPLKPQPPAWSQLTRGKLFCAGGRQITITYAEPETMIEISWLGNPHTMLRIPTSTGAYRYEDKNAGLVLIHVPAKLQLLDARQGQRLADDCKYGN